MFWGCFLAATHTPCFCKLQTQDWGAVLVPFPTAGTVAWVVNLCPQGVFLWLLFPIEPSPPHSKTNVAEFEFLAIFYLYNFFVVVQGEGIDSPGAVSILGILGWLFKMNNYLYFSCFSNTFVCEIKGSKHDRREFRLL